MKFKKISIITFSLLSLLSITACNKENKEYEEKEIGIYYSNVNNDEKRSIRFYDGIGYIGIKDYYKLLLKGTDSKDISDLVITTNDNINYNIKSPRGAEALVNVNSDILTSTNFSQFINVSCYMKDTLVTPYDGLPWIKIDKIEADKNPTIKTLNFSNYSINIYGDEKDVYFPISILGDMFTGQSLLRSYFDNKNLYIVNGENNEGVASIEPAYYENLYHDDYSKEFAKYAYNAFCFFYDNLAGYSGRRALDKYYDLANGLDKALEQRELGRRIKSYLSSTNKEEYLAGVNLLGMLVADGGHTNYSSSFIYGNSYLSNKADNITKLTSEWADSPEIIYAFENNSGHSNLQGDIQFARQIMLDKKTRALAGFDTYTEKNDIAMIHIDDFMQEYYNRKKWNDYYSYKTNSIPYSEAEGGAVAALYSGLLKAKSNPNIKKVVIDLATNSGGSTDELLYLISILTGNNKLKIRNQLNNQIIEASYKIDRNLDRKFDDEDLTFDLIGDLKVGVTTSKTAFSCGGIAPVYLHDLGIKVLGEECGGGTNPIILRADAYGIENVFATAFEILSLKTNKNIDEARFDICDRIIDSSKYEAGSSHLMLEYAKYYDLDYLSNLIDEL